MRTSLCSISVCVALFGAACGGDSPVQPESGGQASVTIAGKAFAVKNVTLAYAFGEDAYFRIGGDDAAHPDADCVPGLQAGLSLYGELPSDVKSLADLSGRELPFEFTGDGDDANLCFVGSNGLLGVENGTVRFGTVDGTKMPFTFTGQFVLYDGKGESETPGIESSGSGVAHAMTN
jgi:hypothetical protein